MIFGHIALSFSIKLKNGIEQTISFISHTLIYKNGSVKNMVQQDNLQLMKTLDDAWNSQDWETFKKRHADNVAVFWPGQPEPTRGRIAHHNEAVEFFKTFPDNHLVNNPYKILFGQGDYTCSVAEFTGTMKGPMKGPGGKTIPPTNRKFKVEFCTVAHWKNGEILEEKLFYDLVEVMRQIGLG
jgi:predicted ester cyclase